ncbi:hypothetical protein V8E51_019340 [Hyaloscypha variabilis]
MCFHPFPLLPTEIRLQIWTLSFPESRRIIPARRASWWRLPDDPSLPPDIAKMKHLNWANTGPKALWVSRESRQLALKHYPARDLARLKQLEVTDSARYPAHIAFAKDVICFPAYHEWITFFHDIGCERRGAALRAFISSQEMPQVSRVELYIDVRFNSPTFFYATRDLRIMKKSVPDFLERVHMFPNAREIFVGILITGVEGDLVERPDSPPGTQRAPISLSEQIQEARDLGRKAFHTSNIQNNAS